jgi:hypothetical protein
MSLAGKLPRWFILSSIAVVGLVLIGIQIFKSPSQWEIIPRDIGIALIVAPILAFTIDRWTKNELREDAVKATLHAIIRPEFHGELLSGPYTSVPGMNRSHRGIGLATRPLSREQFTRLLDAAEYLAAHIHEAPVWIVLCLQGGTPTRRSGSSFYPAVQNMLLAARALGLGATLTTVHLQFGEGAEAALGLPPGFHTYALLPIGYPMGRFGPVRRVPNNCNNRDRR